VRLTLALLRTELRELFVGRAYWAMLVLVAPLVGFSFAQAVSLYAETSQGVGRLPALARNLVPLDGIVAPTFGALYLMNTFLLPFVAIRQIAADKQSGALKLVLQLPVGPARLISLKLLALSIGWLVALVPVASALVMWRTLGGHLYAPEVGGVLLGHAVYALVVVGIAFVAATVTESSATAAIVTLAVTLGSWALEFAAGRQAGPVRDVAAFSLTPALRTLERGLLDSTQTLVLLVVAAVLFALAAVWLPSGRSSRQRGLTSLGVLVLGVLAASLAVRSGVYVDLSEDRRNSFSPADEQALRQMDQPLLITVHLAPGESRLRDLDRGVLSKLRRVVPNLDIQYADTGRTTGTFGAASSDPKYGVVEFSYAGAHVESRSTSAAELLPLIHGLAGRQVYPASLVYPGYPLEASLGLRIWWFIVALPALGLLGWWLNQRPPRLNRPARRASAASRLRAGLKTPTGRWASGTLVVLLAIQAVPFGHDGPADATPAEAATTCATLSDPDDSRLHTLADLRTALALMRGHIDETASALNEPPGPNSVRIARSQLRQFNSSWEQARMIISRLYPRRCGQLYRALSRLSDSVLGSTTDADAARPALASLRTGIGGIAADIDSRIGAARPTALLDQQAPETTLPPAAREPVWDSPHTRELALQACYACHGTGASTPGYTRLAPISWLAGQQAQAGRAALDFSTWDQKQTDVDTIVGAVESGQMPPPLARVVAPASSLSRDDRAELVRGLRATLRSQP
jgi:mono/diheme cytochrome c family protein/ABC-type transport system involved in multi-copper enzyme maturation permease subunit